MLSELFVAASSSPPKLNSGNSTQLKDAGIFVHAHQPQPGLRSTFKKSVATPGCLAVSDSHIFTAQADKAVVHVYNREKGNQESTVPFPEKITSILLAADDTLLALGTEGGGIILWELCTGRQVSTPQAHLHAVNVLAVDPPSNFLLSGGGDASVLVWSLPELLSFPTTADAPLEDSRGPRQTLSAHRSAITSIVTGRSYLPTNIAVTASKDLSVCIWNYRSAELLRTFLLPVAPLCICLDPIDRALYAGFEDGSVQLVNFYPVSSDRAQPAAGIHDVGHASTPIQPPASDRWTPAPKDAGALHSMCLTFETTTLLTGHASGKILAWDIASGSSSSIVADYSGAPITNLQVLPPVGFPNRLPARLKMQSIVKPRPHAEFSSAKGAGVMTGDYTFTAQFPSDLAEIDSKYSTTLAFDAALVHPSFPDDMLADGITELAEWSAKEGAASAASSNAQADFMSLDTGDTDQFSQAKHDEEIKAYQERIDYLKKLQHFSNKRIERLVREKGELQRREDARAAKNQQTSDSLHHPDERSADDADMYLDNEATNPEYVESTSDSAKLMSDEGNKMES